MSAPPKPWENSGQTIANNAPDLPARPTTIQGQQYAGGNTAFGNTGYGSGYGGYNAGGYGNSYGYGTGYGAGGYGSAYSSGLYGNRMGMGGMYGSNSYGGYSSMPGGYGGMYGNRIGMGNVRLGPNGFPIEENISFAQQMEQSTQSTFQVLDQIVQAFGGFSQMLESTFFATHSSFMAMMGVADQFGQLRGYLGQIFSIVSIYKTMKNYIYQITGNNPPVDPSEISLKSFEEYSKPKPSKRPLIVFLAMMFGVPYLFTKLFQYLEKNRPVINQNPLDLRNLEFCKALYDFSSGNPQDLPFKAGDLIAVLSKLEPESEWWRGRTQEGRVGIFPKNYVALIPKRDSGVTKVGESSDAVKKGEHSKDLERAFNNTKVL